MIPHMYDSYLTFLIFSHSMPDYLAPSTVLQMTQFIPFMAEQYFTGYMNHVHILRYLVAQSCLIL